ncbi:MAG: hypothetical protein ACKV2T_19730 [Kofleriaceae bacterium]
MRALAVTLACAAIPSVARADRCEVTYMTAPEGIREVIDRWVAAEPNCRGTIALRVIPTKDGLYLFAERPDGTVHERLVPDLTAAGVLVTSWVADPWRIERPRKKKRTKRRETDASASSGAPAQSRPRAEMGAVGAQPRVDTVVDVAPRSPRKRWVSLGGTIVSDAQGANLGFRLEADVLMFGGWKLGIAAQKVQDTVHVHTNGGTVQGQIDDWSVGALISRTVRWRGWELRGSAGAFLLGSRLQAEDFYETAAAPIYTYEIEPSAAFEASATIARDIGDRWGIGLTAAAMYISQDWHGNDNMVWYERSLTKRKQAQPVIVASLRRRI